MSKRGAFVTLVLVPRTHWETRVFGATTLAALAAQAIDEETRLAKRPEQVAAGRRYSTLCSRIEALALVSNDLSSSCPLPDELATEYFVELSALSNSGQLKPTRWAASFHSPGADIKNIAAFFRETGIPAFQWKAEVLERASKRDCGVVELASNPLPRKPINQSAFASPKVSRPLTSLDVKPTPISGSLVESLQEQLTRAKLSDTPINISNFLHPDIAEGLHGFVYSEGKVGSVRFSFTDRSEATPFRSPGWRAPCAVTLPSNKLSIALISMRHASIDERVAVSLLRNSEISGKQSAAQQEAVAFGSTINFLSSRALEAGGTIELYQTGLEPAVVGFYRGAVSVLQNRLRSDLPPLAIVPIYFRRTRLRIGRDCR